MSTELIGGGLNERIEALTEQTAHSLINQVDQRVRSASDRWHAAEWLIIGVCVAGLLIGQRAVPQWGWRWVLGYFLVGSLAMAIHLWRRSVKRTPSRWMAFIWPAVFVSTVLSGLLLDALVTPRLSPITIAVAALPTLPGLAAVAWTHAR